MRLNLGSGNHYAPGWTNLDLVALRAWSRGPDICASVYRLPFRPGSFGAVYLGHVLEHLEWEAIPAAGAELRRICRPRAKVAVVGPCLERAVATGQPMWLLHQILTGQAPERPGARHCWTPTGLLTTIALLRCGFVDVTLVPVEQVAPPQWPNPCRDAWQCAALAYAP